MSVWDSIKRWFGIGPPERKVASLGGDEVGLDVVSEKIDLSGKPLKPNRARKTHRDPRLFPKKPVVWPNKRKAVMTEPEAARLFSRTHRTKDRRIRDLLPDEEQLGRLGLPIWRTEEQLAEALGITVKALHHFATHRIDDRHHHYVRFAIRKRSGGERIIMAPKKKLKALQRTLHASLVARLPISEHAHGFLAGRSTKTGAEKHVRKAVVLRMDLADFFPSVTFRRVRGFLISVGYGYPIATTLAVLMTEAERQPVVVDDVPRFVPVGERYCVQGAPTSPGLANAIATKLDRRLAGLAKKHGFRYTRYADDLIFSGDDAGAIHALRKHATSVIATEGFAVNRNKTRVMRRSTGQRVTGVTVNESVGLSKKERRRIRALIHQHGADPARRAEIRGKLAYVHMLNPAQAERLRARWAHGSRSIPS